MGELRLYMLGPFQAKLAGQPVKKFAYDKVRALLVYLAIESHLPHAREKLATLLWPEASSDTGRTNLRKTLSLLRKTIGDNSASQPYLIINQDTIQFNSQSNHWLDVAALKKRLDACLEHAHVQLEGCDTCIQDLEQVANLYQGDFLQDLMVNSQEFEEWALTLREHLHARVLTALHYLTLHYLHRGRYSRAQRYALRQIEMEPYREEAHRALMSILARSDQRSAALAQYENCRRILAEELGVEPSPETQALYKRIRSAGQVRPHNLPFPLPILIGRGAELQTIGEHLTNPDCRLLALVGMGGIGKTCLALQSAQEHLGGFLHGTYWIPLESAHHPEQIITAITNALPLTLSGSGDPKAKLLDYLRQKSLLLVFDNFEHLLPSAPAGNDTSLNLLNEILQAAPQVKLLVTSRQRLGLRAEWVIQVDGLPHPVDPALVSLHSLPNYAAIQLFVRRAQQVVAGFEPPENDFLPVARICQLLHGIPLGIELAAGWVDQHTCQTIADEIEADLDFLTTSLRDVPDRHQSLQAVFDHSWKLFPAEEQAILRKLSVFQSPFSRRAARQVSGALPHQLAALTHKSFLRGDPTGHYSMHLLLKQYLVAELANNPVEDEHTRGSHAKYYAQFLKERETALVIQHQITPCEEIGAVIADVQVAWDWAIAQKNIDILAHSLGSLSVYFWERNQFQEGLAAFEKAVQMIEGHQALPQNYLLLARLRSRQANFLFWLGDLGDAERLVRESIDFLQRQHDEEELAFSFELLGRICFWQGDYQQAKEVLRAAIELTRQARIQHCLAHALSTLANVICDESADFEQANLLYEESLALYQETNNPIGIAKVLINQGIVCYQQGNYPQAQDLYQRSLAIYRQADYSYGISAVLNNLAIVTRKLGDFENAQKLITESLSLKRETGNRIAIMYSLLEIGALSLEMGDYVNARGHFCEALNLALETQARAFLFDIINGFAELYNKKGETTQAAKIVAWVLAQEGVGQEARGQVEALYVELEKILSASELDQCKQRASQMDVDNVVAELIGG